MRIIVRLVLVLVLCAPLLARAGGVYIPQLRPLPSYVRDSIDLDNASLGFWLEEYDREKGAAGSGEDFLFAYAPERMFGFIVDGRLGAKELPAINGLLYQSGHQGGVWLHRLITGRPRGLGPVSMINLLRPTILHSLDRECARRRRLVDSGEAEEKRRELDRAYGRLIQSYGYNRGYLLTVLRHPPAGAGRGPDELSCVGLLDCRGKQAFPRAMTAMLPMRARLEAPPDESWQRMAARLREGLPPAQARGEKVWADLMAQRAMGADDYNRLVDVSVSFLWENEAVLLLCAQALADNDEAAMDRALVADEALTIWLGAYLLGLGAGEYRAGLLEPWAAGR
jgi:hypothetical protein